MKYNELLGLIKNEEVKSFINEIPAYIKDNCKIVNFNKSHIVTCTGENIEKIYISLDGKMKVKNEFANGFVYNFAEIDSISYIGVMEIMADENIYSSTLETTTECIMIEMEVEDFKNWIINDHNLTLKVLKFVSKGMHIQSLKKGEGFAYPAIYLLISYLKSAYEDSKSKILSLQESREEIGSKLGFSIRTINRNIKILKDENLITVNRKTISINEEQFNKLIYKLNSIK